MKNRVSIPMLTNLVGVQPSTINAKFEAHLCIGLRYIDTVFLGRQNHDNQIDAKFEKKSCTLY